MSKVPKQALSRLHQAGWDGLQPAIVVLGGAQRLVLLGKQRPNGQRLPTPRKRFWPVSTGRAGFGSQDGSGCTPIGLHQICATFGARAQPGTVFKSRQPTGQILPPDARPDGDFITTRILWLDGLEAGLNQGTGIDSRTRYIYIHGTPHADRIGQPVSAGCVRMRDRDVIQLFSHAQPGTLVLILPPP
ncbi:MAG: L,D-transpeptidase [Magnetococcales bacterium]|nr:L,D-transpeptidase [Magnetococcales bacterium]